MTSHNTAGKESTMDKVKDALHLNKDKHSTATGTTHTTGSTNAGPHDTNIGNKADPRFDSDLDNRGATGHTTGTHTTGGYSGSTNAGPHDSNLANKADPRFDSDLDNRGTTGHTTGTHTTGTTTANHGLTGTTGTPHTGGLSNSTNAGPHDSNLANKADPRVDSDLDGKGNQHGHATGGILGASGSHATRGSGTAQNTDGPHNSDMLNKIDPRVDSDRDASKTIGGNKTNA